MGQARHRAPILVLTGVLAVVSGGACAWGARTSAAARASDEAETPAGALALDLGFSSHSHFTAAFRRAFGVTPSEFRASTRIRRERRIA